MKNHFFNVCAHKCVYVESASTQTMKKDYPVFFCELAKPYSLALNDWFRLIPHSEKGCDIAYKF